jgi:hypothetical protein
MPWPQAVVDGGLEEEAECSTVRNMSRKRRAQGKCRSDLWILSPLSTPVTRNRLTWHLVFALLVQVYSLTDKGAKGPPLS